jgi:cysteine desulfurase
VNATIYLDHNASTPLHPRVREAVVAALDEGFGNPSAAHAFGRRAREIVEQARAEIAGLLDAEPDEIVLTGGGTESNNLALRGIAAATGAGMTLVISAVEHPATTAPAAALAASGATVCTLPVDARGVTDAAALPSVLGAAPGPKLVSVMLAQNETGVLQPVREIAAAARRAGALVHTDAAQAVGKVAVSVRDLGVDLLSVAGHKLYAPKGVGALWVRRGVRVAPLVLGAGHERGLRPGTENVSGIAGLGAACVLARETLAAEADRQRALRDRLEARLVSSGFVVHGAGAPRLPNTLSGRFPGVRGSALVARLPELAFSTGSACHSGEERASSVLLAMGLSAEEAHGAVRLSLGRSTTVAEVDLAAAMLVTAATR